MIFLLEKNPLGSIGAAEPITLATFVSEMTTYDGGLVSDSGILVSERS